MSSYGGPRRAPNVSAYLQNLNQVPTSQELAAQDADFALSDDLTFLTNTEFFDFDTFNGNVADFPAHQASQSQAPDAAQKAGTVGAHGPQYQFGEFQTYPSTMTGSPSSIPPTPTDGLHGVYSSQPHHPFTTSGPANAGDKRTASMAGMAVGTDLEEVSRVAAEEDKRRRNTAASARFRVKKKQREQALESQAKEMTDKMQHLESRVKQLETENKWLKDLLTEKSETKTSDSLSIKMTEKEGEERKTENRTDGVGTAAEVKAET